MNLCLAHPSLFVIVLHHFAPKGFVPTLDTASHDEGLDAGLTDFV